VIVRLWDELASLGREAEQPVEAAAE